MILDKTSQCKIISAVVLPPTMDRPNLFLAFRITNPELLASLRDVHYNCVNKEIKLKDLIVPLETAHVGIDVFRVEEERLEEEEDNLQEENLNVEETDKSILACFSGCILHDTDIGEEEADESGNNTENADENLVVEKKTADEDSKTCKISGQQGCHLRPRLYV